MTVTEYITARSPVLAANARLTEFIEISEELTSDSAFGLKRYMAVGLRVLHMAAMDMRDSTMGSIGAGGSIDTEKEGQLMRSFGSGATASDPTDLGSTSWGLELKALQKMCIMGFRNRFVV